MAKQQSLPEMESIVITELTELAEKYEVKRDARVRLLAQELELKQELLQMMDAYKLEIYRDADLVVIKTSKANVKCKRENDESEE